MPSVSRLVELLVFLDFARAPVLCDGDFQAGSFQGGVGVVDRRLFVDDFCRLQYTRTYQLVGVIC